MAWRDDPLQKCVPPTIYMTLPNFCSWKISWGDIFSKWWRSLEIRNLIVKVRKGFLFNRRLSSTPTRLFWGFVQHVLPWQCDQLVNSCPKRGHHSTVNHTSAVQVFTAELSALLFAGLCLGEQDIWWRGVKQFPLPQGHDWGFSQSAPVSHFTTLSCSHRPLRNGV